MKKQKIKFYPFSKLKQKLMKRPGFKKAYDDLEFEFKLIEAMIEARVRKGVTQKQLAQKIGVAQSALARFESGRINPRLSFLKKVTHGLGLTLTVK
ncbi:MAG: helix-turn-helix transcriptional regulator [Patescibacteria group bacterium]